MPSNAEAFSTPLPSPASLLEQPTSANAPPKIKLAIDELQRIVNTLRIEPHGPSPVVLQQDTRPDRKVFPPSPGQEPGEPGRTWPRPGRAAWLDLQGADGRARARMAARFPARSSSCLTGSGGGHRIGTGWQVRHAVEISGRQNARTWHPEPRSFKTASSTRTARHLPSTWIRDATALSLKSAQVKRSYAGSSAWAGQPARSPRASPPTTWP